MASQVQRSSRALEASNRLSLVIDALDAVRDLCCAAADGQAPRVLAHTDADHFASLLGLIIGEMRVVEEDLQ